MRAYLILSFLVLLGLASAAPAPAPAPAHGRDQARATTAKCDAAAVKTALQRGSGIFGQYSRCTTPKCSWMSKIADSIKITDLSLPGTHDTASWNYTPLTQLRYLRYTGPIYPSALYQCQTTSSSIFSQLASGIRAFDLRVGASPASKTKGEVDVVFWHSEALLDDQARFEDVMLGMWKWLDENPSEALFVSIKIENTTFGSTSSIQQSLYSTLTSHTAQGYVNPSTTVGSFTLSSMRGKMLILRRFGLEEVSSTLSAGNGNGTTGLGPGPGLGINLNDGWADNNPDFTLTYTASSPTANGTTGGRSEKAYIEDLYEPDAAFGLSNHVKVKLDATTSHLSAASIQAKGDGLYITFASGEKATELILPETLAQGTGVGKAVLVPGVNQGLLSWLSTAGKGKGSKKKGIVFLDFATNTPGLIDAIIG